MHLSRRAAYRSLLALTFLLTASAASSQQSTRLLWQFRGVENVVSAAWIEDLDGDETPDILFESYDAGASATDHLFAISGASSGYGTAIWSARPLGGPSNSGGYGEYCLSVSPDVTGDGVSDVLYGAAWGNRSAFALDGMDGSTVWSFDTYEDAPPNPPESGWVYGVNSLGSDLTDDGYPEVLFCVGSENDGLYCANGATGEILWFFRGQDAFVNVFSIQDVNGDAIRDVVACQIDNYPKVYVISGAGGAGGTADIIWSQAMPGSPWGCVELLLPGPLPTSTIVVGCWDGRIYGYLSSNGAPRWDANVGSTVMRVVVIEDVDGDQIDDLGIGSWGPAGRVHSGADGSVIWATPVGDDCWTVDVVDDTNGDGHQELAVGSFNGNIYLMDGVTGDILWNHFVSDKIYTVRGVPDLTGNGIPDVVAGTQLLNGSGGWCYALEGNDDVAASVDDLVGGSTFLRITPNPSPGEMRLSFSLRSPASRVSLDLFSPTGRLVRSLYRGGAPLGATVSVWDGRGEGGARLPAGIYLARLTADGKTVGTGRAIRLP